jgi:hypothetical protein
LVRRATWGWAWYVICSLLACMDIPRENATERRRRLARYRYGRRSNFTRGFGGRLAAGNGPLLLAKNTGGRRNRIWG